MVFKLVQAPGAKVVQEHTARKVFHVPDTGYNFVGAGVALDGALCPLHRCHLDAPTFCCGSFPDLLVVAFDIVLAGCIAPLFAAIYFKKSVSGPE